MNKPSEALRALMNEVIPKPAHAPVTWGELLIVLQEALRDQEQSEYEECMGEDL